MKDTHEQPDKQIRRARPGRALSTRASVRVDLASIIRPEYGCVHAPGSSPKPMLWGFYGGFITQLRSVVNSISSPSSIAGEGWVGLKMQSLQSQLGLSGLQPLLLTSSHLIRTRDAPCILLTWGFVRVLGALQQGPGAKSSTYLLLPHSPDRGAVFRTVVIALCPLRSLLCPPRAELTPL